MYGPITNWALVIPNEDIGDNEYCDWIETTAEGLKVNNIPLAFFNVAVIGHVKFCGAVEPVFKFCV